jgi:hypothetical protein
MVRTTETGRHCVRTVMFRGEASGVPVSEATTVRPDDGYNLWKKSMSATDSAVNCSDRIIRPKVCYNSIDCSWSHFNVIVQELDDFAGSALCEADKLYFQSARVRSCRVEPRLRWAEKQSEILVFPFMPRACTSLRYTRYWRPRLFSSVAGLGALDARVIARSD